MSNSFKSILVVGGSGFVGSHTADILSIQGYKVTILDQNPSPWIRNDQKMIIGSFLDTEILNLSMKNIDCVYFFAGIADIIESTSKPVETIEANILGLTRTLESAVKNKIKKFIYASTMYVYGSHGSFYRASKQAAEIIIEAYNENFGLNFVLLRYGSLYGPRSQNWNGVKKFVSQIYKLGFIEYPGDGSEVREYIHVQDAAKLSFKALDDEYNNKAITITGQHPLKVSDMLVMLFEISGKKPKIKYLNQKNYHHYGKTPYRYSPKPSMKIIPSEFVDLGQGLLDVIEEVHQKK